MTERLKTLAFAGSLRERSFNRALIRNVVERAPDALEIDTFDLSGIPLFNADVEAEGDPDPVARLKAAIHEADLVLIATPEYNQGLPAVTKNAVDWASRPPKPHALDGRPVAIMGATPGRLGTVGAQRVLRESLSNLNAFVMPQPRLFVAHARDAFDDELRIVDEKTLRLLDKFMGAAAEWAGRWKRR